MTELAWRRGFVFCGVLAVHVYLKREANALEEEEVREVLHLRMGWL